MERPAVSGTSPDRQLLSAYVHITFYIHTLLLFTNLFHSRLFWRTKFGPFILTRDELDMERFEAVYVSEKLGKKMGFGDGLAQRG